MSENFDEIRLLLQKKAEYQARLNLLPYDGTPEVKEQSGNRYIYLRKRVGSRLTSTYVGTYSDDLYQLLLRNAKESKELKKLIRHTENDSRNSVIRTAKSRSACSRTSILQEPT